MEYNKYFSTKKTILLLLAFLVSLSLFACKSEESNESTEASETESSAPGVSVIDELAELLDRDREVIEMFVCNSLCENKTTATAQKVSADSKYASFSAVESLLYETYSEESGSADHFLSYPSVGENALSDKNGATYAFFHAGSGFDDFADTSSISLYPSEDPDICGFSVKTASGRTAELKAIRQNDGWVLEKSLFEVLPDNSEKIDEVFPLSNLGSFSEFKGKILVIELFFSDNSSKFTSAQEDEFHSVIESAVSYLSSEAEGYGSEVIVDYERAYFNHQGVLGEHNMAFDIMFAETGFGTLEKFAERNYDIDQYDNYVFVVCLNKNQETVCNSYNPVSENHESTDLYYAERVFIGKESTDTEVCRALLSMLGADSVYPVESNEYLNGLYRSYFPNDILLSRHLDGASMSPVVAYACGITSGLDRLFRPFIDQ